MLQRPTFPLSIRTLPSKEVVALFFHCMFANNGDFITALAQTCHNEHGMRHPSSTCKGQGKLFFIGQTL